MRFILYAAAIVVCIAVLIVGGTSNGLRTALLVGLATGLAVPLLDEAAKNFSYLTIVVSAYRNWRRPVRISASYLFRIKVGDKYLLIRGLRIPDQFQPVGGVWKVLPEGRLFLSSIKALDDHWVPLDRVSEDDVRIRVHGRYLYQFKRWFVRRTGRELDPWREFYEELVRPGILPASEFGWIHYRHLGTRWNPIRHSDWVGGPEWLIADIFELVPSPAQDIALQTLAAAGNDGVVIWADADQIGRLALEGRAPVVHKISQTASWIL